MTNFHITNSISYNRFHPINNPIQLTSNILRNIQHLANSLDRRQEILVADEGQHDEAVDGHENVQQKPSSESLFPCELKKKTFLSLCVYFWMFAYRVLSPSIDPLLIRTRRGIYGDDGDDDKLRCSPLTRPNAFGELIDGGRSYWTLWLGQDCAVFEDPLEDSLVGEPVDEGLPEIIAVVGRGHIFAQIVVVGCDEGGYGNVRKITALQVMPLID
jgi:hypothetical protein